MERGITFFIIIIRYQSQELKKKKKTTATQLFEKCCGSGLAKEYSEQQLTTGTHSFLNLNHLANSPLPIYKSFITFGAQLQWGKTPVWVRYAEKNLA